MAEPLERISEPADAMAAHILADLHDQRRALAELLAQIADDSEKLRRVLQLALGMNRELVAIGRRTELLEQLVNELAPAARIAARFVDSPVSGYLAARAQRGSDGSSGTRTNDRGGLELGRRRSNRRAARVGRGSQDGNS